jgi:predicted Zn-dependent protease with MMP-like domain
VCGRFHTFNKRIQPGIKQYHDGFAKMTFRYQSSEEPSRERFETLVDEALESIPAELWNAIDNVAIMVQEWPSNQQMNNAGIGAGNLLLGLYEGVPLTSRTGGYGLVPPDKITIFRRPILQVCPPGDEDAIRGQVKRTVLHEIAHHFGISDQRLRDLGAY